MSVAALDTSVGRRQRSGKRLRLRTFGTGFKSRSLIFLLQHKNEKKSSSSTPAATFTPVAEPVSHPVSPYTPHTRNITTI